MSTNETTNNRRQPEGYSELLELATIATSPEGDADSAALHELSDKFVDYDLTTIDRTLAYVESLGVCKLAKLLHDPAKPDLRDELVQAGARKLIDVSDDVMTGGISGLALADRRKYGGPLFLDEPFADLARRAHKDLTPAEIFLGTFALATGEKRRAIWSDSREDEQAEIYTLGEAILEIEPWTTDEDAESSERPPIEQVIGRNFVLSAAYLAYVVLNKQTPQLDYGKLPSPEARQVLHDISLERAALRACGLTSPDFFGERGSIIDVDEKNTVKYLNPYAAPRGRPTQYPDDRVERLGWQGRSYYMRDVPIVCAAANVKGIVPYSVKLQADIVDQACEMRKQERSRYLRLPKFFRRNKMS